MKEKKDIFIKTLIVIKLKNNCISVHCFMLIMDKNFPFSILKKLKSHPLQHGLLFIIKTKTNYLRQAIAARKTGKFKASFF